MKDNFNGIITSHPLVLVDFFADWCGPCQAMSPILKDVKQTMGADLRIIKINVDKNQSLASKYQVKGIPTLLLFKNGKQVWRQSGVVQKDEIIRQIQ